MKFHIKNFPLMVGLCLWTLASLPLHDANAGGKALSVKARRIEVPSPIDDPNYPLVKLSEVLKSDSTTNRFRLEWFYSMGSFQCSGVATYNRAKKMMDEQVETLDGAMEMGSRSHVLYRGVTDAIIHRASQDIGDKGNGPFSFDFFPKYGVVATKLK